MPGVVSVAFARIGFLYEGRDPCLLPRNSRGGKVLFLSPVLSVLIVLVRSSLYDTRSVVYMKLILYSLG